MSLNGDGLGDLFLINPAAPLTAASRACRNQSGA